MTKILRKFRDGSTALSIETDDDGVEELCNYGTGTTELLADALDGRTLDELLEEWDACSL